MLQNAASFLMQISPLLFMVLLSLVSTLFISDPVYSLLQDSYVFTSFAVGFSHQHVVPAAFFFFISLAVTIIIVKFSVPMCLTALVQVN